MKGLFVTVFTCACVVSGVYAQDPATGAQPVAALPAEAIPFMPDFHARLMALPQEADVMMLDEAKSTENLTAVMRTVADKASELMSQSQQFAWLSLQQIVGHGLTPQEAAEQYQLFCMQIRRMMEHDLAAFRRHASWLEGNVQEVSPNVAPRSIAVAQRLSCAGSNVELMQALDDSVKLWKEQIDLVTRRMLGMYAPVQPEQVEAYRVEPVSQVPFPALHQLPENKVQELQTHWQAVQQAYDAYHAAWSAAHSPLGGYRGSGTPLWVADMEHHMLSHWETLVSWLMFHNRAHFTEANASCFMSAMPEGDAFPAQLTEKLTTQVKRLRSDLDEDAYLQASLKTLIRRSLRLYDARMRYAQASLSCAFYYDARRVQTELEKYRTMLQKNMLQDVSCLTGKRANRSDLPSLVRKSITEHPDAEARIHKAHGIWVKQMQPLMQHLRGVYDSTEMVEPVSGLQQRSCALFGVPYMQRIQDILEETDSSWQAYEQAWHDIVANLASDGKTIYGEVNLLPLYVSREQLLMHLYNNSLPSSL